MTIADEIYHTQSYGDGPDYSPNTPPDRDWGKADLRLGVRLDIEFRSHGEGGIVA